MFRRLSVLTYLVGFRTVESCIQLLEARAKSRSATKTCLCTKTIVPQTGSPVIEWSCCFTVWPGATSVLTWFVSRINCSDGTFALSDWIGAVAEPE